MTIFDNGSGEIENGKEDIETQNGRGLQNVRSRLSQIYGENYAFEMKKVNDAGTRITLKIPTLSESIKVAET